MKFLALTSFLFLISPSFSQEYNFEGYWENLGPLDLPYSPSPRHDVGIGPVEFIRVYQKEEGFLLAGSLNGGLFYSVDGAESWINGGSDYWPYSTCAWADFYPDDKKTWFAYSHHNENNGNPGSLGEEGGLYRTRDQGSTWVKVLDKSLYGSKYVRVLGTRFHPKNPKMLFVMSSNGLHYTNDCLSEKIKWIKVENLDGWVYDLDFLGEDIYVSNMYQGKWNVNIYQNGDWSKVIRIGEIEENNAPMRTITFEPAEGTMLILVDNSSKNDELYRFIPNDAKLELLGKNQTVNFGSGHTFAVSPYNPKELLIGASITIKKWFLDEDKMRSKQLQSGYHVDVEFAAYDPFDSTKIYLATHGGVFISYNKGESWEFKSKGLGNAEVMGLSVSKTDPNMVAIGCFHDGTSIYADWNKDGKYFWRIVNGGDALIPIIHPEDPSIVYTSNQYSGGGIYYSNDTAKTNKNIFNLNGLQTAGWELGATLHPIENNTLYFSFKHSKGEKKGCIDACRTRDASKKKSAEVISDFKKTHDLENYKVYSLFNSPYFPDELYAYVLNFTKENDKTVTHHRLFKTEIARDSANKIIDSWYELEVPRDYWIADLEPDPISKNIIYLSYTAPDEEYQFGEDGMVYALKYGKKNHSLKKQIDLTGNMPGELVGRYNLVIPEGRKEMFVVSRSGVYYGSKKQMKGRRKWIQVGFGLPHCKPFGIEYVEKDNSIVVGLMGRGVWKYRLE